MLVDYSIGLKPKENVCLLTDSVQTLPLFREIYKRAHQKALASLLNTDDRARRLGECGIGTNPRITRFMDELLFDEKMLGTVHVTPENSYESLGVNKSDIHADIVKDLRQEHGGREIQVDGEVVQKNGKWTFI